MAIKVIHKTETIGIDNTLISPTDIVAINSGDSLILTEAVKQSITIKYDAYGKASVGLIILGCNTTIELLGYILTLRI